ncbi:MAG TPA: TRAP transporter large permease subunit [bacterium]|nr:TRAP transporter large permease subunit [bacterium]
MSVTQRIARPGASRAAASGVRIRPATAACGLLSGLVAAAVAAIPALVLLEVVARDALGVSVAWYQDAVSICVYIVAFMGGALAYLRGEHLRLTAPVRRLPERVRAAADGIVEWLVFCTALGIALSSVRLLQLGWTQTMQVLPIPETWAQLPLPLGLLIVACAALGRIGRLPRRLALLTGAPVLGLGAAVAAVTALWPGVWKTVGMATLVPLVLGVPALVAGVPVAFVFAGMALLYFVLSGAAPVVAMPLAMHDGVNNFVLIALPCFFLLAYLMDQAGLAARLAEVVGAFLGRIRHGALYTIVATMYVFSGLSGSKSADIAAVGRPLLSICDKRGYRRPDSAAVLAASAAMGETIPPSIALLVVGSITTLSIGALFLGGLIPAAVMAIALGLMVSRRPLPSGAPHLAGASVTPWRSAAAVAPIVAGIAFLVGSIITGLSTPTEASALVVFFLAALAVSAYRSLSWRGAVRAIRTTSSLCGAILLLVASASAVSNAVAFSHVADLVGALASIGGGAAWVFLLVTTFILLVAGAVLEGLPALLLFVPLFMPVAEKLGINPLQYGIAAIIAMGIGAHTPPVGVGLYTACVVGETSIEAVGQAVLPYLLVLCVGLLAVVLVPALSLFLPQMFGLAVR